MGFYGGKTGQHFAIVGVYNSIDEVPESVMSNQFVLIKNNREYVFYVKSGEEFLQVGKVGALAPTISNSGDWKIGTETLGKAQPWQIFLKVPYDGETKSYITEQIVNEDGSIRDACFIKYAYAYIDPTKTADINDVNIPETDWHNLVEISGLHTLNTYVKDFADKSIIMTEQANKTENNAILSKVLFELTKSYFNGDGELPEDVIEYPEGYEDVIKQRLETGNNQNNDNILKYYGDVLAAEGRVNDIRNEVDDLRDNILEHLDYINRVDSDAWRTMVTAELSAAARASVSEGKRPLLTERLDKMVYQFDTCADMRVFPQLRPGDSCITFGINRLGDSHSLLFRIYENDEEMKASGDLYEDQGKYYISLPGGIKKPTEKQMLKNGYVAYAVSMFSGLGGGSGSGGTSSGSISTTYTGGAVQPGAEITIPLEWYGQVSGDGTLYVYERAASSSGGSLYTSQYPFAEGHNSFVWKANNIGNRVLIIYVEDRLHNKTNQLKIDMVVGGLEAKLKSQDKAVYDYGKTAHVNFSISSILAGDATVSYSLNGKFQKQLQVSVTANAEKIVSLDFSKLEPDAYIVDIVVSQDNLPDINLQTTFFITASGTVNISEQFDESISYPINDLITIPYTIQSKDDKTFNNFFYLGGGDLVIKEEEKIEFDNIAYKLIGTAQTGKGKEEKFQLNPEAWNLTENNTYYFMITSQGANYTNITGQLSAPIQLKTKSAEDELEIEDKWAKNDLMFYFDARKGQQNTDANKTTWEDLAPRYNSNLDYGTLNVSLIRDSFNWATNGWNPPGHEGLYFNGQAIANMSGSGIESILSRPIFGVADEKGNPTGTGLTLSFYLKTEDLGEDARLFEFPYTSDGEVGISINTKQVKVSSNSDDYFGLTASIAPNQKTHVAIVFEPIGVTNYQDAKTGKVVSSGLIRIYVNGICRAATTVISDFFAGIKEEFTKSIQLNNSLKDNESTIDVPKYPQGAFELYSIKIFNRNLSAKEVLYNYIHDIKDFSIQDQLINFNKLRTGSEIITNPEICLYPPEGTLNGITKDIGMEMPITYKTSPDIDGEKRYENCVVKWQGTSSIAYPVKNYKIKFPTAFTLDDKGRHVTSGGIGKLEQTYTLKADYMDSSHCHNTCNANFVNDTGLLTEYSLTPAQVKDIYDLNKEALSKLTGDNSYEDILTNIENGIYYYQIDKNNYRPYKLSDFPDNIQLQIRNSIYGIPCELYAYLKTDEIDSETKEPIWKTTFLGIYNFNNDKGNLNTFGLERDINFPGCTSFEIAANSNSTSGAFKERQLVAHYIKEKDKEPVLEGYYSTNLSTTYKLNASSDKYVVSLFKDEPYCECCKFTVSNNKLYVQSVEDAVYLLKDNLVLIDSPADIWSDENILKQYNSLLDKYYSSDFELRAPDNDNYYIDGEKKYPTLEYYAEYDKLKKLISWVNGADKATFKREFANHFDLDTSLNYYLFVMVTGLIDNFGKNLMINTWGCDNTGNIPYITTLNNGQEYYKVRRFSRLQDGADIGQYEYGYSLCKTLPGETQISIYRCDTEDNILFDSVIETVSENYVWNGLTYSDPIENRIYGQWQKMMDEDRFIWYPHPYDLDSCLGLDNMGRLRYGAAIEMLPQNADDGYNDYYDHAYRPLESAFNTATSNLWKKFYEYFSEEIQDRYAELRNKQILHINTFKEYYYNRAISKINAKSYNDDMEAKYLSGEIANVVINGSPSKVYPTSYTFMCHGDDWSRIEKWLQTRFSFLDSLYQYGFMTDVATARADKGTYSLAVELHNPQYLAISWTNKSETNTADLEHIWIDETTQIKYGLVYNVFSLSEAEVEYGFVTVQDTDKGYDYDKDLYLYDIALNDFKINKGGNYYKVYGVNTNNSTNFREWTPNLQISDYKYTTYWAVGLANTSQGSFEIKKVSERFVPPATQNGRIRLVTSSMSFGYSGTTGDQEVNIYGASNIKQLRGLSTLNPRSLNLDGASNLLELECHGGSYSGINLMNLVSLKKVDLSNTMSLNTAIDVSNLKNLTELNLSLTNVSQVTFPVDGGILSKLKLGPQIKDLTLANQNSLREVVLQAFLENNSISQTTATKGYGNISSIDLKNCPNLKFKFQAISTTTVQENTTYAIYDLPEEEMKNGESTLTHLGNYIANKGLFSMFKDLKTLILSNSCLYTINANNEFILSPRYSGYWSPGTIGQFYTKDAIGLSKVDIELMPIKKFIIDATEFDTIFPGVGNTDKQNNSSFSLGSDLEEIYIKGNGKYSVYMPSVNDWSKYINLKKIVFDGVNIYSKERRYTSSDSNENINALAIILPDTDTLKEININPKIEAPEADITSIGSNKNRLNISSDIVVEKEGNIVDLAHPIKINFTGMRKINTIKGLDNVILKTAGVSSSTPAIETFESYFNNCQQLRTLLDSSGNAFTFKTKDGTRWNQFYGNPSLKKMFFNCQKITNETISDFIGKETAYGKIGTHTGANLTTAEAMFAGCTSLTELHPNFVNTLNLQTVAQFAKNCKNITSFSLTAQTGDDFTDLSELILHSDKGQSQLTEFELNIYLKNNEKNSGLRTVKKMNKMLVNCEKLLALDMSDWDLSSLEDATNMCMCTDGSALIDLKLPAEYNFENLITAQGMFMNCKNLKNFNSVWSFANDKGVSLSQMFSGCTKLDLSFLQNWNMKNVSDISYMCQNVQFTQEEFDVKKWDMSSIENANGAFKNTRIKKFFSSAAGENKSTFTFINNISSLFENNLSLNYFDSSLIAPLKSLTSLNNAFSGCTSLFDLGEGYKTWPTSAVSDFSYLFSKTQLTDIDLSNEAWNFEKASKYTGMFSGCSKLTTINGISKLFPSSAIKSRDITNLFNSCGELSESTLEDVALWNMFDQDNNCVLSGFQNTFYGCKKLTDSKKIFTKTLLNKTYSKVTDISGIFGECENCTTITMPKFTNLTTAQKMCYNCTNLTELDLSRVNFYHCNDLTIPGAYPKDALYQWLYGCENIIKLIFQKADESNKIGFLNATIDLSAIPMGWTFANRLFGAVSFSGNGTYAIAEAILPSTASEGNYPEIIISEKPSDDYEIDVEAVEAQITAKKWTIGPIAQ